jgi:hypothetical protein
MGFLDKAWGAAKRLHDPRQHYDKWKGLYNDTLADKDETAELQRKQLQEQAQSASNFANQGEAGYAKMGAESQGVRDHLGRVARGQESVSAEQLRQGLQQNLSAQRSMAASAAPRDASMAARTAAIQGGRMGMGLSGQQAVAGLQERQNAQNALGQMIMQQRQQDLQAATNSRQTAVQANQAVTPEGTFIDKYAGAIGTGLGALISDRREKTDIAGGDAKARRILDGLKAYSFNYKDEKHGKGRQFGVLAQDLEKTGLRQAVIKGTDGTKQLDPGKLAGGLAALVASQHRRISKLEKDAGGVDDRDPVRRLGRKLAESRAGAR